MIGSFMSDNASVALMHTLASADLRYAPLTHGQLAARLMFPGGMGGGTSTSASEPLLNQKDPSKYGPTGPAAGMSTTTMAAIGIGVVAAALVAYKVLGKKR